MKHKELFELTQETLTLLNLLALPTVSSCLNGNEGFDERRARVSLVKLVSHKSDVMSHITIVKRRRNSRTLALPLPMCKMMTPGVDQPRSSADLFTL